MGCGLYVGSKKKWNCIRDRLGLSRSYPLPEKANRVTASAFLVALVKAVPYKIHTVLTDNGIQFRLPPRHANGPNAPYMTHMFALRCREHGIEHRFTKINHPWTNGQVERMNRTIRTQPSNAITTMITTRCAAISPTSSPPTISHAV